jgi:hypothetical protein
MSRRESTTRSIPSRKNCSAAQWALPLCFLLFAKSFERGRKSLTKRDARNPFRFRSYENCRVTSFQPNIFLLPPSSHSGCSSAFLLSHLPYPLPSSVSPKLFACLSYENCRSGLEIPILEFIPVPRPLPPKPLPLNLFADPHPLTTVVSISHKKGGREGGGPLHPVPLSASLWACVFSTL